MDCGVGREGGVRIWTVTDLESLREGGERDPENRRGNSAGAHVSASHKQKVRQWFHHCTGLAMRVDRGGRVVYTSNVAGRQPKRLDAEALMNYGLRALGSRAQSSGE